MKQPVPGKKVTVEVTGRYLTVKRQLEVYSHLGPADEKYELIMDIMRFMKRRPCESVAVQIQDFNMECQSIRFMIGKTNIIADVPVPDALWSKLLDYIERNKYSFVNGYIFPSRTRAGNHVSTDTVSRKFREICDKMGMTEQIPGKQSHKRLVRFYDIVASGTTDLVAVSDETQGRIARRHTDERAIKAYVNVSRITKERILNNQLYTQAQAMALPRINNGGWR